MTTTLDRDTSRRQVAGRDPGDRYPVPGEARFCTDPDASPDPDLDFIAAPDLAAIAAVLIAANRARLGHLDALRLEYRWKRVGGKSAGKAIEAAQLPLFAAYGASS